MSQEVLIVSRSSAYFHLLRSCFLVPAAALVACTAGPLLKMSDISLAICSGVIWGLVPLVLELAGQELELRSAVSP